MVLVWYERSLPGVLSQRVTVLLLSSFSELGLASMASWAEQRVSVQENWVGVLICSTSAGHVSLTPVSPLLTRLMMKPTS